MCPKWHPIWDTTIINHADSAGKWLTSTTIAEVKLLWWWDKSKPMSAIQYLDCHTILKTSHEKQAAIKLDALSKFNVDSHSGHKLYKLW
jgi:hypothetical protein